MKQVLVWTGMAAVLAVGGSAIGGGSCGGGVAATPVSYGGEKAAASGDIVDVAVGAGSFKTLAMLLEKAELVSTLKGDGPFTVFAPTDEAFAKLPKETVDSLLKPENRATLAGILTYHVVSGKVTSGEVVKMTRATTVQGAPIQIRVNDGKVMINDATVVKADVGASNGVIHVIDTVIMPPAAKN